MSKILVSGASGQLGKEVINQLLATTDASKLAVLVRDPAKVEDLKAKGVEVLIGDYNDYDSLLKAFAGVDKLYFVSSSDIMQRVQQHENVVKAAKAAGVKHVIYTSFQRKNETASSPIAMVAEAHIKTENWLKESGLVYTILKHGIYMDMLPMFLGEQLLATGVAYLPAGDTKVAFVLRNDMAAVAAAILTTTGHENKSYLITNEVAVSFPEIAAEISKVTAKTINYVSPSQEEYIKTLSGAGVPMEYVGMFAGFAEAFKQGEFEETNHTIEELLGRKPVTIAAYLQKVYGA